MKEKLLSIGMIMWFVLVVLISCAKVEKTYPWTGDYFSTEDKIVLKGTGVAELPVDDGDYYWFIANGQIYFDKYEHDDFVARYVAGFSETDSTYVIDLYGKKYTMKRK